LALHAYCATRLRLVAPVIGDDIGLPHVATVRYD
jgi:hypothetical protein